MSYVEWTRTQPCVYCGKPAPSENAHIGSHGTAKRKHDKDSCSNCYICHKRWHGIVVIINGIRYRPFTKEQKERMQELAKKQYSKWLTLDTSV